jgi:hypothetical protein
VWISLFGGTGNLFNLANRIGPKEDLEIDLVIVCRKLVMD